MKRALIAIACVACLLAAPAGARSRAPTTLTIDGWAPSDWFGQVKSPKHKCEIGRRVKLYRVAMGPDEKIGSGKSAEGNGGNGAWTIHEGLPAGTYYVKTPRTSECAGDRSKDFNFE
jgi:hypothetical protein